jgi:hypothetical protein
MKEQLNLFDQKTWEDLKKEIPVQEPSELLFSSFNKLKSHDQPQEVEGNTNEYRGY